MSPHARPFRFGVEMKAPFEGRTWADSARELERMGYSTLYVPDHFHSGFGPIAAMATALAATERLCVAPLVMAVDFRHPAVLAKEMATLDVLFPGRVEVGLGAGYNPLDYSRAGIPMAPAGTRVRRLEEYVAALRLLFTGDEVSFHGHEYRMEAITGTPLPATPGGPRLLVAGGGPRLLRFAGAHADIVGVNPSTAAGRDRPATFVDALAPAIDAKVETVRLAAGDRWASLELNAWVANAAVVSGRSEAEEAVAGLARFAGVGVDDVLGSPIVLVGTEEDLAAQLHARRARWGYSSVCLPQAQAAPFAPLVQALSGT